MEKVSSTFNLLGRVYTQSAGGTSSSAPVELASPNVRVFHPAAALVSSVHLASDVMTVITPDRPRHANAVGAEDHVRAESYMTDLFLCSLEPAQTNFRDGPGKVYMTHATKGIYRYIMQDFIRVRS
jgi:hypothetical protein